MNAFPVWLRPLRSAWRVRVDGIRNAQWLLDRLSRSFVFKTSDAMNEEDGSSCCTFHVAYSSQMSPREFERLLTAIPEVKLIADPV
jgi:hypothetical protein